MSIKLHRGDLPADFEAGLSIAIDTETMGLRPARDKLCVVQLSTGDGNAHIIQMDRSTYAASRLKALLTDTKVKKLFHFARFDIATLKLHLGVDTQNIYCTKIASRLTRTYTDRHGLKDLVRELLGIELDKQQQSSDWGAHVLTEQQKKYAGQDVLYLHELKARLDQMLEREGRLQIAQACFDFLPTRAALDLLGWPEEDVFAHA
ncbi:MAG: ribonuclease H-like domain-containing protein [Pseudomonadota bacterium]|nr:ribonuclease H-like domain-containing protein [Pseudomonadota bacterium]